MEKKNKLCLIYNYAQHYRLGIFKKMSIELDCDFYFGDKMGDIKKLDYSQLNNVQKELRNITLIPPIYFQSGAVRLSFKDYSHFIILGEYYCISTWILLIICRIFSKKTHLWTHGWYGNESVLKKRFKKVFFNLGNNILLYGEYAKKLMINEGFSPDKLHVIYNSLDYDCQLVVRRTLQESNIYYKKFKNKNPVLIFIGRLTKTKELHLVLLALQKLINKGNKYNLVFVGEGEEKETLQNQVKTLNLVDNVWFYGASYEEKEIGELLYNSELCISPGNVGLTAMHSLMYGTPVITHNDFKKQMPEFEAIVEGESGDFFIKGDVTSLVDTINNWTSNNLDRKSVREICYKIMDTLYNPEFQISTIKNILNEAQNG